MEWIRDFFRERDRFAARCGVELLEVGPGRARARLAIGEEHLNGANTVHGGAVFTLADLAFAAASNSHGTVSLAINASISYIKGAAGGVLVADAEEVACHPRLGCYTVRVTTEEGELVAIFQGMVYRKQDRLADLV